MNISDKLKVPFKNYKKAYKEYWELICPEYEIEEDDILMYKALVRATNSIEKEIEIERKRIQLMSEAIKRDLKEDE